MPTNGRGMRIGAVEYVLPSHVLDNDELERRFPDWSAARIVEKTGIRQRHIAAPDELASDLAVRACERLLARSNQSGEPIDFLILCTQTPDYPLPTTACLLQQRLGLPTSCAALDVNLGCSGYIYSLSLAYGYIVSGLFRRGMVVTAETYSKYIDDDDRSMVTLFGDAAAATLVEAAEHSGVHGFVLGTDGAGECNLIMRRGSLRAAASSHAADEASHVSDHRVNDRGLSMDGPALFSFTLQRVPALIRSCLASASLEQDDVDLYVFHQANAYMLEALRRTAKLAPERFVVWMEDTGNTGSATIPIVLKRLLDAGRLRAGTRVLLAGFGVGYSWGACIVEWQ